MPILHETILGRLGSRLDLNFRPDKYSVYTSHMGRFYDRKMKMALGIKIGNDTRILPFSDEYNAFESIEQEITPTSVKYYCYEPLLGIEMNAEVIAPFYPRHIELCIMPAMYISVTVKNAGSKNLTGDAVTPDDTSVIDGEIFLSLQDGQAYDLKKFDNGFKFSVDAGIEKEIAEKKWLHKTKGKEFSGKNTAGEVGVFFDHRHMIVDENGISASFCLKQGEEKAFNMVYSAYTKEDVLNVKDGFFKFKYTGQFNSINEVGEFALQNREEFLKKSRLFDDLFKKSTIDRALFKLISMSMQTYLSNSWWVVNEDKGDWFSVWEGNCAYHSTIDVEYNISPFYLFLWPELLEKLASQWAGFEKPGGYMSHDMGKFLAVKGMEYSHDLEIEENCNYILLLYSLYKFSGKPDIILKYYQQILRLTMFIKDSDTTGNGFPNSGTANTIDDAGSAIQYSKEQTYLGIKVLSAFSAVKEFAAAEGDHDTVRLCEAQISTINETLDREAWMGDHYAVCIDKYGDGLKDVWTGKELEGEIPGWDAYSIYACNGLLYLLMTASAVDIDLDRIRQDILNAADMCMTRFGCLHSSEDPSGILWISQNLWRDMVAAYLGIDMLPMAEKYWDFELYQNSKRWGGCYVDTAINPHLNYYPRGIASIGLIYAAAGVQVDACRKRLYFNPVRVPCRIPLLSFADWKNEKIPWAGFSLRKGVVECNITDADCLLGYDAYLFGEKINILK